MATADVQGLVTQVSKKDNALDMSKIVAAVSDVEREKEAVNEKEGLLGERKKGKRGKKCLVLDLDETLVHSSFKKIPKPDFLVPVDIDGVVHTVYVLKRPFADKFLKEMAEVFEIVLFTASLSKYADPLLDLMDTSNTINHRLFREHCVQKEYCYVKDLSKLGRPLKDCIIIDNSAQSYIFQPQNAIPIPSWFDDQSDTALKRLIPLLKWLGSSEVKDVSKVLDAKKSFESLFKKNARNIAKYEDGS